MARLRQPRREARRHHGTAAGEGQGPAGATQVSRIGIFSRVQPIPTLRCEDTAVTCDGLFVSRSPERRWR